MPRLQMKSFAANRTTSGGCPWSASRAWPSTRRMSGTALRARVAVVRGVRPLARRVILPDSAPRLHDIGGDSRGHGRWAGAGHRSGQRVRHPARSRQVGDRRRAVGDDRVGWQRSRDGRSAERGARTNARYGPLQRHRRLRPADCGGSEIQPGVISYPRTTRAMREQLNVFRGREVKTTGTGYCAIFDSPTVACDVRRRWWPRVMRWGSRSVPACTPARWSSVETTFAASQSRRCPRGRARRSQRGPLDGDAADLGRAHGRTARRSGAHEIEGHRGGSTVLPGRGDPDAAARRPDHRGSR